MFISIDGGDGCGKSTQMELLHRWLRDRGCDVVLCRDPGSTPLAEHIRDILLHGTTLEIVPTAEMLLFMAARAQMVAEVVRPALDAGNVVLCDRFLLATIVYQGYAGGVPLDAILDVGKIATQGVLPDVGIVLDIPREIAVRRMEHRGVPDRMEGKGEAYHERVRNGFLVHAAAEPQRYVVVDATGSIEEVAATIRAVISQKQPLDMRLTCV
ncbi:MAG TPA: dTMP kinase [Planctomycetaceae bacterium]|nr:dTMP kinase [Planctomycetaceae bacterium]